MRPLRLAALLALATAPLALSAQDAPTSDAAAVDEFAQAAAQSSLTEVLMSALALQRTTDRRVEEHAWTMLDHHGRALGDLAEALGAEAALLPTEPGAEQAAMLERMRAMEGAAFDQAYLAHQVDAHERAVTVFEQGSEVPDEQVAQFARTTLPVLRAHLEIAELRQAQPPQPIPGQ